MLVEINKKLFNQRVQRIYDAWKASDSDDDYTSIAKADALLLTAGDATGEDEPPRKVTSVQQWLLGYEFPSTIMLFHKDKIGILTSVNKAKHLSQLEGSQGVVPVQIFAQPKAKDNANDPLPKFFEEYASSACVGTFTSPKEQPTGKTISEWQKLEASAPSKPELVDMAPAISAIMTAKDADELKSIQTAAELTSTLFKAHISPRLERILDQESKISHELLSAQIEARLGSGEGPNAKGPDMKVWDKLKNSKIDFEHAEFAYPPIIISRSTKTGYDLKYTAESSKDNIAHKGVVLVACGMRFKSYCANAARTFMVDPTKEQEAQYDLLLSLQEEMLSYIKAGVAVNDVYQRAVSFVREKKPDLEKNFAKNVGFAMGIEFRDSNYLLSGKNNKKLQKNMILNLGFGFSELNDGSSKYALHLADTIRVGSDSSSLLTEGTKSPKETQLYFNAEEDEQPKKADRKPPVKPAANGTPSKKTVGGKVLRNQRRATQDEVHVTAAQRLAEHQRDLHERLQSEGSAKYNDTGEKKGGSEGKSFKKFQSYKGEGALPQEVDRLRIIVDRKAQSVILPINGFAVPFHINTIKNASKNDEGEFTFLRINFQTPGQLAGKKEDTPFEDPDATFIRSVSYRSADQHRFDSIYKQITDLKKEANKREQTKKEMADVVEQDNLVELRNRRPAKMPEAFLRPALDGKRLPGEVEIHQNGLRYQSPLGGQKVDILFSNIKHLFFQPCDHELLVIVHINLRAPIIIGKKKTSDVQFFREASDSQFDETGNRKRKHRYGDEDEIEMEQQERKHRNALNKEIKAFAEKIAEAASNSTGEAVELDIPFRELSFEGVPGRSGVRLQPTTECLVHLTDPPFLVVTLSEIEIASLERVQFSLRQFDLVFIFKDYTKAPLHINNIASTHMDDVKNWLDSVDIPMAEGPVNLNWGPIMKQINENPHDFFEGGGWSFLGADNGAASEHSDSSDSESDFAAESDVFEEESSEASEAYSDASGSDSGSDFGDDSEDDSGEDWDELERKAAKSDQKKVDNARQARDSDDDDSDRPKKKKGAAPKKAANGKSKGKR